MENPLPPIFTPEEFEENEAKKKKLADLILSGQAVLVAGAGTSAELGYPTWIQLIDMLEQLVINCRNNFQHSDTEKSNDRLAYVDKIKDFIRNRDGCLNKYENELINIFSPKEESRLINEFHKNLVSLPFKGILTTNYDVAIENAMAAIDTQLNRVYNGHALTVKPKHVSNFFLSLDSHSHKKKVLHLHGYYDDPSRIILSKKDYIEAYQLEPKENDNKFESTSPSWSLHRKVLWSILATRLSVWIGFSMTDTYLNEMLKMVSDDLWRWDEAIHFALMSINNKNADENKDRAKFFKENFGMEVVFYESTETDHSNLNRIIEHINEKYRKQNQKENLQSGEEPAAQKKDHLLITHQDSNRRDSSGWLDRINQMMEERTKLNGN